MSTLVWTARHIIIISKIMTKWFSLYIKIDVGEHPSSCWCTWNYKKIDQSSGYINEYFLSTVGFFEQIDFLYCTYYTWRRVKNGSAKMFISEYTKKMIGTSEKCLENWFIFNSLFYNSCHFIFWFINSFYFWKSIFIFWCFCGNIQWCSLNEMWVEEWPFNWVWQLKALEVTLLCMSSQSPPKYLCLGRVWAGSCDL